MNQLKTILTILLAFGVLSGWAADAKILAQSKGRISFVVDETPKIGWMVRVTESDQETLNQLKKLNDQKEINLRVKEVPEVLKKLKRIERLNLEFIGEVTLPDWFFDVEFKRLDISGKMSEATRERLKERWPKASLWKVPDGYHFMLEKSENRESINKEDLIKL